MNSWRLRHILRHAAPGWPHEAGRADMTLALLPTYAVPAALFWGTYTERLNSTDALIALFVLFPLISIPGALWAHRRAERRAEQRSDDADRKFGRRHDDPGQGIGEYQQ